MPFGNSVFHFYSFRFHAIFSSFIPVCALFVDFLLLTSRYACDLIKFLGRRRRRQIQLDEGEFEKKIYFCSCECIEFQQLMNVMELNLRASEKKLFIIPFSAQKCLKRSNVIAPRPLYHHLAKTKWRKNQFHFGLMKNVLIVINFFGERNEMRQARS